MAVRTYEDDKRSKYSFNFENAKLIWTIKKKHDHDELQDLVTQHVEDDIINIYRHLNLFKFTIWFQQHAVQVNVHKQIRI